VTVEEGCALKRRTVEKMIIEVVIVVLYDNGRVLVNRNFMMGSCCPCCWEGWGRKSKICKKDDVLSPIGCGRSDAMRFDPESDSR
jgi:hypothetical protein